MKKLLNQAVKGGSLAVVGMAKNAGKTVTISYLLAQAATHGLRTGLTSTGLDGETTDSFYLLPKPEVWLPAGSLFATARASLSRGSARLELLVGTGLRNPMGEIVIARVRQEGTGEISGPETCSDLVKVISLLSGEVDLVLVDGALDRVAASAPSVTGGAVLATGAVVASDVEGVVRETVYQARVLMLPPCSSLSAEEKQVISAGKIAVSTEEGVVVLPLETAVDGPLEILDYLTPHCKLLLGGAFTDQLGQLLLGVTRRMDKLMVIVRDGTRIFVGSHLWQQMERSQLTVRVLEPINLVAVSVNPVDIRGRQLPGDKLVSILSQLLPGVSVFNPLATGGG